MNSVKVRARQSLAQLLFRTTRSTGESGTLTVLMYHAVTAQPIDDEGQMSVSAAQFDRHLTEIAESGVEVMDLVQAAKRLRRGDLAAAAVAIVFDDGFVGVHDHAAGALARRGFPATVFVTTSWIGRAKMPLADPRLGRPLTWSEVEALNAGRIAIGNHTATHPSLPRLERDAIATEVNIASDDIADRVGRRPDAFAYPFGAFGSFDARTREVLVNAGMAVGCTTVCGRNRRETDPLALRRIRVSWCDGTGELRKAIAGCYDWYRWVQRAQTAVTRRAA